MVIPPTFRKSSGLSVNVNAVDLTAGVIKQPFYLLSQGTTTATSYAMTTNVEYSNEILQEGTTSSDSFTPIITTDFYVTFKAPILVDGTASVLMSTGILNNGAGGAAQSRLSFALYKIVDGTKTIITNDVSNTHDVPGTNQVDKVFNVPAVMGIISFAKNNQLLLSAELLGRHVASQSMEGAWAHDPKNRAGTSDALSTSAPTDSNLVLPIKPTF